LFYFSDVAGQISSVRFHIHQLFFSHERMDILPYSIVSSKSLQKPVFQFSLSNIASCRRNQKLVEQALTELGYAGQPKVYTRAVVGAYLALRGEICHMLELKRQVRQLNRN
jgi:hypothetical protein